jgi:hypothetical protein
VARGALAELEELERLTGGRPCDLGNIEVFYRLALFHLAHGDLDSAIEMFDVVEETSPGYRDAWKRAEEVRARKAAPPEPPHAPAPRPAAILDSLQVIEQVLAALEGLHSRRIVHGDLHPSSLVRTAPGVVTLQDSDRGLALPGGPYQAPEQLASEPIDVRCDLFSVAVILYEMLTGRLPYEGDDRATPPAPLLELLPDIPPELDLLVMRALAPRKEDRWSSAFVMRSRLEKIVMAISSRRAPP